MRNSYVLATALIISASTSAATGAEVLPESSNGLLSLIGPGDVLDTLPDTRTQTDRVRATDTAATAAIAAISASSDNSRASLKVVRSVLDNAVAPVQGSNLVRFSSSLHNGSLILSAPLDKSNPRTTIFASGALPSDFQAKIGYSIFNGRTEVNLRDYNALVDRARARCREVERENAEALGRCTAGQGAPTLNAEDVIAQYLPDYNPVYRQLTQSSWAYTLGFEASVGYLKSDFLNTSTSTKESATSTPWSAKGYIGWVPTSDALLVLAGLEYQDSFKDNKSGTICPVVPGACLTGALDSPKETRRLVTSLELRRQLILGAPFSLFGVRTIGVTLKAAYDAKNQVTSFDLPLTFAMDEKKNLVGGLRFGWQSDEHDFVAGLFVGSAFSLF